MSALQWILLGSIFTLYLLFGGCVFMTMEQGNEIQKQAKLALLKHDIQAILLGLDEEFYNNGTPPDVLEAIRQAKEGVISRISETCAGTNFLDVNSTASVLRWTFYNSVFYAFTAVTTIGYGNLAPETHWSRIFTIFYALIGIPLNGVILTKISGMYNNKLVKVRSRSKTTDSRITFAFNIIFYLIPGFLIFIVIPAAFFVVIENWGYLDAIYFCFVSLTTIGFGDYVAGMGDGHKVWLWVYKIAIIFWIVFGLGYLVMILGFITKGITSKKVRIVLEKKLNRIRITKEKLANDVEYMRKVVNELYLAKSDTAFLTTSDSAASLDVYLSRYGENGCKRSKSFFIPRGSFSGTVDISLIRSFSESDLDRFNKAPANVDSGGGSILAQLVASLEGDISDVLEAVADLNSYETEPNNNEVRSSSEIENDKVIQECIETVDEIDDEILLDDAYREHPNLEEIVVHKSENKSILDKVSGVFRKISSGKPPSQPPSRKISRNESETKLANNSAQARCQQAERGAKGEAAGYSASNCDEMSRNCSQTSFGSGYDSSIPENGKRHQRVSMGTQRQGKSSLQKNVALDPNSLADLLKVLDNVQEQLGDQCYPSSSGSDSMIGCGGNSNLGFVESPESTPTPTRRPLAARNRKVGIFNPDFKYFSPDLTGVAAEKRREYDYERSLESH